jgi:hypothetical protein
MWDTSYLRQVRRIIQFAHFSFHFVYRTIEAEEVFFQLKIYSPFSINLSGSSGESERFRSVPFSCDFYDFGRKSGLILIARIVLLVLCYCLFQKLLC